MIPTVRRSYTFILSYIKEVLNFKMFLWISINQIVELVLSMHQHDSL